uniref:SWIM-type domain-containing protein n=1 Tax=Thermofilum pendens TaxID=2269 RepID=A0A7C4FFP1_THEPE
MSDLLRARKALAAGRVRKISLECGGGEDAYIYAVLSADRRRYYVVIPGFYCSCPDFLFSVVLRGSKDKCYHLLAVDLALKEGVELEELCLSREKFFEELLKSLGFGSSARPRG